MGKHSTHKITQLLVAWNQDEQKAPEDLTVGLRLLAGLSLEETAEALKVSVGTVRRDLSLAGAWLFRELNREEQPR